MTLVGRGALTALGIFCAFGSHLGMTGCGSFGASDDPAPAPAPGTGEPGENLPPAPPPPSVQGKATVGVFVSATKGADDGDGTLARPVKTISAGLALGKQKNLPVNVCAESYAEAVTLIDGVTAYGYFECNGEWVRGTTRATIISPTIPAVLAQNLTLPARFEGFEVIAPDVTGAAAAGAVAASSYGMIVRGTKNLSLAELVIRAGQGQDGAAGAEPAEGNVELSSSVRGIDSEAQSDCVGGGTTCILPPGVEPWTPGGAGGVSQCRVGPNGGPGGQGGDGPGAYNGNYYHAGNDSFAKGKPNIATAETAVGGKTGPIGYNDGSKGSAGAPGRNGDHGKWSVADDGFVPGDGAVGANGLSGQGGGGGYGAMYYFVDADSPTLSPPASGLHWGAAGGGGGAGGCGGIAGAGGKGGGASIGLLVVGTEKLAISASRIEGKKGGRAGKGAVGTLGTKGNGGGIGRYMHPSLVVETRPYGLYGAGGGSGGDGGSAGLAGHGAPGPSIALAFKGARPQIENVELVPGTPGEGVTSSRGAQSHTVGAGEAKPEHSF